MGGPVARPRRAGPRRCDRGGAAWHALALAALAQLAPARAHAQGAGRNDGAARGLVREALESYQGLDIDRAVSRLRTASQRCARRQCSPQVTAEVHVAFGVVLLGGRSDAAGAQREFETALRADPRAQVDPTLVTPEITATFARARRALRGANPLPRLLHDPVVEQLERTPVPVYVETGQQGALRVDLYYRPQGAATFTTARMERIGRGWGAEIPCAVVRAPAVEYYVAAIDERELPSAEAGAEDEPLRVNIVSERTRPAPSLPGRLPSERCRDPGERRALGEACAAASECVEGLRCERGVCATAPPPRTGTPFLAAELGVGFGLAPLPSEPGYAEAEPIDPANPRGPATCRQVSCPASPEGVAAVAYLWLAARVMVHPRVALAVGLRWQPDAARRTTLASLLISARGYVALTERGFARTGLVASVFAGTAVGQIQPRPNEPSAARPGAETGHIVTGLNNVHAGGRIAYGFDPGVVVGAELALQYQFPRTLFVVDLTAVGGIQF